MLPTVEEMLNSEPFETAAGHKMTGKEYLDQMIKAFDLNPCDYFTAHYLGLKLAKGEDSKDFIQKVKSFWNDIYQA